MAGMRFREHRGSLADAMTTEVHLDPTMEALSLHLMTLPGVAQTPFRKGIRVEPYDAGPDNRIGWEATFIVTSDEWPVLGFTDRMPIDCLN